MLKNLIAPIIHFSID